YKVLETLAHEFYHFIQVWRDGDPDDFRRQFEQEFLQRAEQVRRAHPTWDPDRVGAATPAGHSREQDADRSAAGRLPLFKVEIDNGSWDQFLPVPDLEWYVRQNPDAGRLPGYR